MYIKKVFVELKRRKQVENRTAFVEQKMKKQDCLQFSYAIKTLILFVIQNKKKFIWMTKITSKKFSVLITYRHLYTLRAFVNLFAFIVKVDLI
jgi:hypothetical protein